MKKKELKNITTFVSNNGEIYGFLFIGDPHVWSKKPGRRRDVSYLDAILNKLKFAAKICNEQHLWPIILGDLLHESTDNDLNMISRLTDTLQLFKDKPFVLVGNHDLKEQELTQDTTLYVLNKTDQIYAITKNGIAGKFEMVLSKENVHSNNKNDGNKKRVSVLLGGTPYGKEVPLTLDVWSSKKHKTHNEIKKYFEVDESVWITHDDFAFDYVYPGSLSLKEILGVDYAINGHVHNKQSPLLKGHTAWYNPGNISRLTIDLIDQVPMVWKWLPCEKRKEIGGDGIEVPFIEGIEIPHIKGSDILSLEGKTTYIDSLSDEKQHTNSQETKEKVSDFVNYIKEDNMVPLTDDGTYLLENIDEELNYCHAPENIKKVVHGLFNNALKEYHNK